MTRHLNLIPVATQRRHMMRRVIRVWSTSMVAAGVCVAALLGVEWLRGMATLSELQDLDARYAPFAEIHQKSSALSDQITRLKGREQLTLRLSRDDHGVALLGALALASRESGGSVFVKQMEYDVSGSQEAVRAIRLQGAGVDGGAIAGFAEGLRESGVFTSVAVESTGTLPGGAASLRQFTVACRL